MEGEPHDTTRHDTTGRLASRRPGGKATRRSGGQEARNSKALGTKGGIVDSQRARFRCTAALSPAIKGQPRPLLSGSVLARPALV